MFQSRKKKYNLSSLIKGKSFKTIEIAISALEKMGFSVLTIAKSNQNGPDLHVEHNGTVFRVEVKKARPVKQSMAIHPVEKLRQFDDLICIVFPSGYVLIEPMKHHLKACAKSGSRSFFGIK